MSSQYNEIWNMQFPIVKKTSVTTMAEQINSVQPSTECPPIKRQYTNHMGDSVVEYERGMNSVISYHSDQLYGSYGHSFGMGNFIVNEHGEMVFDSQDSEQYNSLIKKCQPFWKILKGLQEKFSEYRVEMSRGERLAVNDKIMKGFLFYPGMVRVREGMDIEVEIQKEIEYIANEIQLDIDKGRIIKGEYGAE